MNKNIQLVLGVLILTVVGAAVYTLMPKSTAQPLSTLPSKTEKTAKNTPPTTSTTTVPQGQKMPFDMMKDNSAVNYTCSNGKSLTVKFAFSGQSTTTITLDGQAGKKTYDVTAKIVNKTDPALENQKAGLVFVNKGNYSYVEEGGKITYDQCTVK